MKLRNLAVITLLTIGLALAGCTKQASKAPTPTNPPAAQSTPSVEKDKTMAVVELTVGALATQNVVGTETAVAKGGGGGAEKPTPQAMEKTPEATVQPEQQPTPTPQPPAPVATPLPAAGCSSPYSVKQGDWIYKIARECQVDPQAIVAANPGISPNFIIPGQKLNLPATSAVPQPQACAGNYTVVKGDTLYNIAYRCGVTTEQLAVANGIRYPFLIHPGDVLKFP